MSVNLSYTRPLWRATSFLQRKTGESVGGGESLTCKYTAAVVNAVLRPAVRSLVTAYTRSRAKFPSLLIGDVEVVLNIGNRSPGLLLCCKHLLYAVQSLENITHDISITDTSSEVCMSFFCFTHIAFVFVCWFSSSRKSVCGSLVHAQMLPRMLL